MLLFFLVIKNKLALSKIRGFVHNAQTWGINAEELPKGSWRGRDPMGRKRVSSMHFSSPVGYMVCFPSPVDQRNGLVMSRNWLGFADEDFGYGFLLVRKLL